MSCTVQVEQGWLEGKECESCQGKKYYSFEGIPYAKPPLGRLRFANPQKPDKWDGIRLAKTPADKCAQINPYSGTPLIGSEDCLYLNVYTPMLPAEKLEKLPVILFVHGGRLLVGYGDYYTPDYLIKHDVILVTINYRLHILGFLCLNLPEAPGNVGIKDAVYALRWVGRNISSFNGNPENITVFGESAGGAIVTSFLTSKMCIGAFSKVIAQSGNCLSDLYLIEHDPVEKARKLALVLGKELRDERALYEFLVQVPLEDLVNALAPLELGRPPSVIEAYFLPVIEKNFDNIECFFDEHPIESIKRNRVAKVPTITGYSTHEAAPFVQRDDSGVVQEKDFHYFIPRYLRVRRDTEQSRLIQAKLREVYFKDTSNLEAYLNMTSDAYYLRDILYLAEALSRENNNLYLYQFSFLGHLNTRVMKNLGVKGTTHGDMIQYQFYRKSKAVKCKEDGGIVEFLSECWSNFAKNGVPSWSNQKTKWLTYSPKNRQKLIIDNPISIAKEVNYDRNKFWFDLIKERSKL